MDDAIQVLFFYLQKWNELVIIDVSNPAGRESDWNVSQVFVKLGM